MIDWQCTGLGRSPADSVIRHNDTPNRSRRQDLGYDRRPVPGVAGYVLAVDDERSFPFPVARGGQRVAPGRVEDGSALLSQDPLVDAVGRRFALDDLHDIGADERHGNIQFPGAEIFTVISAGLPRRQEVYYSILVFSTVSSASPMNSPPLSNASSTLSKLPFPLPLVIASFSSTSFWKPPRTLLASLGGRRTCGCSPSSGSCPCSGHGNLGGSRQ